MATENLYYLFTPGVIPSTNWSRNDWMRRDSIAWILKYVAIPDLKPYRLSDKFWNTFTDLYNHATPVEYFQLPANTFKYL